MPWSGGTVTKLEENCHGLRVRSQSLSSWFLRETGSLKDIAPRETILSSGAWPKATVVVEWLCNSPGSRARRQSSICNRMFSHQITVDDTTLPSLLFQGHRGRRRTHGQQLGMVTCPSGRPQARDPIRVFLTHDEISFPCDFKSGSRPGPGKREL